MLAPAFGGGPGAIRIPAEEISPLFGKSYNDLGIEGRSQHVSQGTPAEAGSSFLHSAIYLKVAGGSESNNNVTLADLGEPLSSLAKKNSEIASNLKAAESALKTAREEALRLDWPNAARHLAQAAKEIKSADRPRRPLLPMATWLLICKQLSRRIESALADSIAFNSQARADRRDLVAGENFSVCGKCRGAYGVSSRPRGSRAIASQRLENCASRNPVRKEARRLEVSIPANAQPPVSARRRSPALASAVG